MTYLPSIEERKMMERIDKWIVLTDDGHCVLREDAPEQIKKDYEHIRKVLGRFN